MTCPKVYSKHWRRSICIFFKFFSLSCFGIHKLHATHTAKSLHRRCCSCCCAFFSDIIEKFLCALHSDAASSSGSTAASAEWANDKVERIVGTCCQCHASPSCCRPAVAATACVSLESQPRERETVANCI